ncbi:hypothetical protein ACLM5J_02900 [Nocardioides sp. Bht2]|uniref:hypothetical protein n=1 Tax=Nocardioides sp. Bht2 TaxID=3392297 RepID=UPI0039B6A63A
MDQHFDSPGPVLPSAAVGWLCGDEARTVAVAPGPFAAAVSASFAACDHEIVEATLGADGAIELDARSVDVLVLHQLPQSLESYARALRPGGQLAVLSHQRDRRIPWARKLDVALGADYLSDPAEALACSGLFGFVSDDLFRHWQQVNHESLAELIRHEFGHHDDVEQRLAAALELYADYGRGNDGMQLPWVSACWKATVLESAWSSPRGIDEPTVPIALARSEEESASEPAAAPAPVISEAARPIFSAPSSDGSDLLLIDFR